MILNFSYKKYFLQNRPNGLCSRGAFLLEFCIVLPILLGCVLCGFEIACYIRTYQSINKLSYELSKDILAKCTKAYGANDDPVFDEMMRNDPQGCITRVVNDYATLINANQFLLPRTVGLVIQGRAHFCGPTAVCGGAGGCPNPVTVWFSTGGDIIANYPVPIDPTDRSCIATDTSGFCVQAAIRASYIPLVTFSFFGAWSLGGATPIYQINTIS